MKRLMAVVLSVLLVLSAFVSCAKDDSKNDDSKGNGGNYVSVIKEEWIKAFELDGVNSFTVKTKEHSSDDGDVEFTMKMNGDNFYYVYEDGYERETAYGKIVDEWGDDFMLLSSLYSDFGEDLTYVLEDYLDYAYANFRYNESKSCYETFITKAYNDEYSDDWSIKIYFGENKLVSKIEATVEYDDGEPDTAEFVFSDYNSTAEIVIPKSQIKSLVDNYPEVPSTAQYTAQYIGVYTNSGKMAYDESSSVINAANEILSNVNVDNAVSFYYCEEGSSDTSFELLLETSPTRFELEEIEMNYVKVMVNCMYSKTYVMVKDASGNFVHITIENY